MRAMSVTLRSVCSMVTSGLIAGIFAIGSASALAGGLTMTKVGAIVAGLPTFTITITNVDATPSPDNALSPQVVDPLPGMGGTIVWSITTDDQGSCDMLQGDDSSIPPIWPGPYLNAQQVMWCDGHTLLPGESWTIVVTGTALPSNVCSLENTVFIDAGNYPLMEATGTVDSGNCGRMTGGGSIFANDINTLTRMISDFSFVQAVTAFAEKQNNPLNASFDHFQY